jgi:hypothetical protein
MPLALHGAAAAHRDGMAKDAAMTLRFKAAAQCRHPGPVRGNGPII